MAGEKLDSDLMLPPVMAAMLRGVPREAEPGDINGSVVMGVWVEYRWL